MLNTPKFQLHVIYGFLIEENIETSSWSWSVIPIILIHLTKIKHWNMLRNKKMESPKDYIESLKTIKISILYKK